MKIQKGKHMFVIVVLGIVLFSLISYVFAFKKSFELQTECEDLEQTLDSASMAPKQLEHLRVQISQFQQLMGDVEIKDFDFQSNLIQTISEFSKTNSIELYKLPTPHEYTKDNLELLTYSLTIKGNYVQLVALVNELEKKPLGAKIVSVYFDTKKDIKAKNLTLYMTLYIQKINNTDEK